MPIYCDESGGVGRGVMTLAAISIEDDDADAVVAHFCEISRLSGEIKGSRIDLGERALLFELLGQKPWAATISIAISALALHPGEDRGAHDIDIYARLLKDAVSHIIKGSNPCVQVVIDDGRYGPETLALIRKDIADLIGPYGTALLDLSHGRSGLQIADVIANTFFNRAMATERQGRMAAIVAPFLESGKISLRILSSDTEND